MKDKNELINDKHYFLLENNYFGGYELYDSVREAIRGLLELIEFDTDYEYEPKAKWTIEEVIVDEDDEDKEVRKRVFLISEKNLIKSNEDGL